MSAKLSDVTISVCGVEVQKPYMDGILTVHTREPPYLIDPDELVEGQIVRVQCREVTEYYQKIKGYIFRVDDPKQEAERNVDTTKI